MYLVHVRMEQYVKMRHMTTPVSVLQAMLARIVKQVRISRSVFVSPELSSGRDLVIQMSVRRAPSAVRRLPSAVCRPWFFVRSISQDPYDLP